MELFGYFNFILFLLRGGPFLWEKKGTKNSAKILLSEEKGEGEWIIWNLFFSFFLGGPPKTTKFQIINSKRVIFILLVQTPILLKLLFYYQICKWERVTFELVHNPKIIKNFRNSMSNEMIFCVVWSLNQIILPILMMCFKGTNACGPKQRTKSLFKIDHLKLKS